jgi:hypothetical protein
VFRPYSDAIVALRVGDGTYGTSAAPGTALPLYWDWYEARRSDARWLSVPVASVAAGASRACTLAAGTGAWVYDAEGLPSSSANGGYLAFAPCYNVPAGGRIGSTAAKTIAVLDAAGRSATAIGAAGGAGGVSTGARGAATGWRQVASLDGRAFYTGSVAASRYGFRYIGEPGAESTAVRIYGQTPYPDGSVQGGTNDVRSVAVARGYYGGWRLYGSSSSLDAGWDTVFSIGGMTLPTGSTGTAAPLKSMAGLRSPWTFVFETRARLWVAVDDGAKGTVQVWAFQSEVLGWARVATVTLSSERVRSITGRVEFGGFVLYAADRRRVYRYDTVARATAVVATAAAGTAFRGVALPPRKAVSPSRSASPSRKASRSGTPTRSRSRSRKQRAGGR